MPGRRQVSKRIVREHCPDPDQNGIALRPQQMRARFGEFARNRHRFVTVSCNLVVGGDRQLQDHMRTPLADAPEMSGMSVSCFRRAKSDIDHNPGIAQLRVALPRHFRIGVLDRRHHACDAGSDDGIRARRRLADMRTGLERHIKCGSARRATGLRQRHRLGMGAAARLRPAPADNDAVLDDDRSDGGIGMRASQTAPAKRQRERHETPVN